VHRLDDVRPGEAQHLVAPFERRSTEVVGGEVEVLDERAEGSIENDDALADSIAAMNLFLDEPKNRRRVATERVRQQAGDDCRNEGPLQVENALRGRWRMRCRTGDLRVSITLAPTEPAKVQFLEVTPIARDETIGPVAACR